MSVPLRQHLAALREADLRRLAELREADQRALAIKEVGDAKALELAREYQTYKDMRDNRIREQLVEERGLYVTRAEFKPIADFIAAQQGGSKVWNFVIGIALALAGFVVAWLLRS